MRVIKVTPIIFLALTIFLNACFGPEPQKPKPEEFLTLADLTGRVTLQEDSPDEIGKAVSNFVSKLRGN